jgi:hypothetical protein
MNNGDRGGRPDWDDPTDPGLGQPRPGQTPPRYGQPSQPQYPRYGGSPQYGSPPQYGPPPPQYGGRSYGAPSYGPGPERGPRPTVYDNDDDDFGPEPGFNRKRMLIAAGGGALALIMLVTFGFVLLRPGSKPDLAAAEDPTSSATVSTTPTVDPTTDPPTTTTPPRTTTSTKRVVLPKPTVTVKPPAQELPPAPPPPAPPGCSPTHAGTDAPFSQVKSALQSAAAKQYWQGVVPPDALAPDPLPVITVPTNLMFAIAQQESGWQSTIMACDGGIGTMQVMPDTVTWLDGRFGTTYDPNTLDGNTKAGARYIEWLIMYFGLFHFQKHFDLSTVEKIGPNGEELTLERVVVAAYNVGYAALEQSDGTLSLGPIATTYSNNVLALKAAANWPA